MIDNRLIARHVCRMAGLAVAVHSLTAFAYIGPGAGLTAIGAALALVGAILLGIIGFLWYPIKRLVKRRRSATAEPPENDDAALAKSRQQNSESDPEGKPGD